jgi:hypothetical protein
MFNSIDIDILTSFQYTPEYLAESRVPLIVAGNIIVQIIGTFFFIARAYTRIFIVKSWKSEDYVLTVGFVSRRRTRDIVSNVLNIVFS